MEHAKPHANIPYKISTYCVLYQLEIMGTLRFLFKVFYRILFIFCRQFVVNLSKIWEIICCTILWVGYFVVGISLLFMVLLTQMSVKARI